MSIVWTCPALAGAGSAKPCTLLFAKPPPPPSLSLHRTARTTRYRQQGAMPQKDQWGSGPGQIGDTTNRLIVNIGGRFRLDIFRISCILFFSLFIVIFLTYVQVLGITQHVLTINNRKMTIENSQHTKKLCNFDNDSDCVYKQTLQSFQLKYKNS